MFVHNPGAPSPFLLLGDHAGRTVPPRLGDLGLPSAELERHIAWDIGVDGLGRALSRLLDATFVAQSISRLVIDCNRDPASPNSILEISDGTTVPGNLLLSDAERSARRAQVFEPYHGAISNELDQRAKARRPTLVIALHSFTPLWQSEARPWQFGVLHMGRSALSAATLEALRSEPDAPCVGDNAPYEMDGTDYTIPHHAIGRGLDYLELEVRQDLMAERAGQEAVAARMARVLNTFLNGGSGRWAGEEN